MQGEPIHPDSQPNDEELVRRVQEGDAAAFEPLLDRHIPQVRAFLALRAPVAHLVDEVAHETFVFAYHNLAKFEAGTSLHAWLRAIAWNLLRAEIQRYSREQAGQSRYVEQRLADLSLDFSPREDSPLMEYLAECMEKLPQPSRDLLQLKYHHACTSEEIAGKLQRSLAWVRTVLFRVRQQLKDCVELRESGVRPC
jgi:RNA polymerase sigma-70 factor (ECF subfamily)